MFLRFRVTIGRFWNDEIIQQATSKAEQYTYIYEHANNI